MDKTLMIRLIHAERAKTPQVRLNKAKRLMTKWMNENIDSRYRRAVKIQKRYEEYTGRLQGGLDSECSITFVADDEDIDEDIERLEGEDALGARSERPDMAEKIGAMNRMINTFRKFGRVNLAACEKLPIWNAKAEKLRQGLKKAINRSTRLRLKANKDSLKKAINRSTRLRLK